jgi:hypothetical protein
MAIAMIPLSSMRFLAFVFLLVTPAAAQLEAWRTAYDSSQAKPETFFQFGGIPFGDHPIAVAPDGSLTSLFTVSDGDARSFLTRHDAAGELQWRMEYPGSGASTFFGGGAAESDDEGNTFVCGLSTSFDAQITKIDPLGQVVWAVTPSDPISLHLLAPGPDGSVYAAGNLIFNGIPTIYVVRLSSDGMEEWRYVREDAAATQNGVIDLAVDGEGNAVIGGFFWNPGADYLVVKIDPDGEEVWTRTFDGGSLDGVHSVAIGPSGRVTVTGVSAVDDHADYVTIQYDADGTERWTTSLARPEAPYPNGIFLPRLAVDSSGASYVVGESGVPGEPSALVVKYAADGDEAWRDTFGDNGMAVQVTVDDADDVYVAGVDTTEDVSRLAVLSYEPSGTRRWVHLGAPAVFTIPAALLLDDGKVLLGATAIGEPDGSQVLWLAVDAEDGDLLWQVGHPFLGVAEAHCRTPFPQNGMADQLGSCLALGPDGSTYLAGFSAEKLSPDGSELRTLKLENGGDLDWTRRLSMLDGANTEVAKALATDAAGNVVVAGFPWVTVKYDANGNEQWVRSLEQPSAGARFVGMGPSGAAYVSGTTFPSGTTTIHLIKYDTVGNETWSRDFQGPAGGGVEMLTQLVTADERVVLAGQASSEGLSGIDGMVRSYDAAGGLLFSRAFDSPGVTAWITSLAAAGTDVVAAGTARSATDYDVLVVRLESDGDLVWRRDLDSDEEGDLDDEGRAVAVDPATGAIYVAGRTWNGEDFDVLALGLDAAGNQLWRRVIDVSDGHDEAWAAAFDSPGAGGGAGSFWIAGFASNGHDTDALTLRFDAEGNELFRHVVAGTDQRDDEHYDLVVGPPGHATVAGRSAEVDESYNIQAIRYVAAPLDVDYDGEVSALGDGLLILRWLFGFRGAVLETDAVDTALCVRCLAPAIDLHLGAIEALLDVDGSGAAEPLADGLLILRWLFGFRGSALVAGAVDGETCTRCDAESIEAYLAALEH